MKRKLEADKDLTNVAKGFVQQISPVKQGNRAAYFDGYIQTNTNHFKRFICFDKEKHEVLHLAAVNQSPLKLTEVREVPSRIDATKTDIIVNNRSKVEVGKLDFMYTRKQEETNARLTVLEIQKVPEKNQVYINQIKSKVLFKVGTLTNSTNISSRELFKPTCILRYKLQQF